MTPSEQVWFERQVVSLADNLYGAAMRLTRDPAEAHDLVQETMTRACCFWDTFKQDTNVKAWMFTILRNTFINSYHRRNRRSSLARDIDAHVRGLGDGMAVLDSRREVGSDEVLDAQRTIARVRSAIAELPDNYREAISMCDLEGMSYKEIAEAMDCPIGTVMSRIYRGRKLLHVALRDHAREVGLVGSESA